MHNAFCPLPLSLSLSLPLAIAPAHTPVEDPVDAPAAARRWDGGGELRIRVLRDPGLDLMPRFVTVDGASSDVRTGDRFAVREEPYPWVVTHEPERLVFDGGAGRRLELKHGPLTDGSLPRYGDDRHLVEILGP